MSNRFSSSRQPAQCLGRCGRLTTGVDGTELCRFCSDKAGEENTHSDEGHSENNFHPSCTICIEEYSEACEPI